MITVEEKLKQLLTEWNNSYKFNEKMIEDAPGMEPMLRGAQATLMACIIELGRVL